MPDTREQIIERMARAIALKRGRGFAEQEDRILATAALTVVGRSITGRVRNAQVAAYRHQWKEHR